MFPLGVRVVEINAQLAAHNISLYRFTSLLLFFDKASGEEHTEAAAAAAAAATAHDSFELSQLNDISITPFGLPGMLTNLRFVHCFPCFPYPDHNSNTFLHSFTFSCTHTFHVFIAYSYKSLNQTQDQIETNVHQPCRIPEYPRVASGIHLLDKASRFSQRASS